MREKDKERDKPYVVYWNNIPAPYMVERFNAIAERGGVRFEAWFNERTESDRSWDVNERDWKFSYRYLPSTDWLGRKQRWPTPVLGRRPDVLVSLYAEPCFVVGWMFARLRGAKTAFWCQVTSDRWVKRTALKNLIKRWMFRRVDLTLGSGQDSRAFAMKYGTAPERAKCLPHSIDVDHYMQGSKKALQRRDEIRQRLGLQGTTFIYVGRLWSGKGIRSLLDAFREVQDRSSTEVSLLIVGDGPDEAVLKEQCTDQGIENVVFAGFVQKEEVPAYYAAADVFVFPTLGDPYGLVVDEAMACALPVISTDGAGEIEERVEDGVNGYVVPVGDVEILAARMQRMVDAPLSIAQMGQISQRKVAGRTPESWAERFETIVLAMIGER